MLGHLSHGTRHLLSGYISNLGVITGPRPICLHGVQSKEYSQQVYAHHGGKNGVTTNHRTEDAM
jgi:hypothetical protein